MDLVCTLVFNAIISRLNCNIKFVYNAFMWLNGSKFGVDSHHDLFITETNSVWVTVEAELDITSIASNCSIIGINIVN